MNIYDVMSDCRDALAADSQLMGWAVQWFDNDMQIFIDPPKDEPIGEQDPEGNDTAPYIQLHSWFKNAATDNRQVIAGFRIYVVIFDEDTTVQPLDNANEISGVSRLTSIIRRINAVILSNRPTNSQFSYQWDTDTEALFPALVASGEITFSTNLTSPVDFDLFY